jgi:anti-sigma factor RsiW
MSAPSDTRETACRDIAEHATGYLDGALPPSENRRFRIHLSRCPFCTAYVEQMRTVSSTLGGLSGEPLAPARRAELVAAFRGLGL